MSITAERKSELIKEHARGDNDTGSPEIQVAILSALLGKHLVAFVRLDGRIVHPVRVLNH